MPNSNLPTPPYTNEPIPNEPFDNASSSEPYLGGPYSPLLLGEGLAYCGDYILSPAAIPAIPIGFLTAKGTIISALSCATPAPIALGQPGQILTVDPTNTDTGISWCDPPSVTGCLPCSIFNTRGQLLSATGPSQPVALNVGTPGSYLTVDSSTPTGLSWASSPYAEFTAPYQLVVSCSATCAIPLGGGIQGDVLYYDGNAQTGWATCPGDALFVPQEGFDKGYLVVGCAANESDKLPLAIGSDGYVLTADSNCALGVKWGCFSQQPQNTVGCFSSMPDGAIRNTFNLIGGAAFPEGASVYVTFSGSWYGNGDQINGDTCLVNGSDNSFAIPFDNSNARSSRFPLANSYVFTNWCNACPLIYVFDNLSGNAACIYFQASAFQLKP